MAAELTPVRNDNLDFLQDAPVPMFVVDTATSHIVAANPAAEERYGYTVPQLLLVTWDQLIDWDAQPRVLAQRAFEDAQPVDVELTRHKRKDGTSFQVETHTRRIMRDGRHCLLVAVTELSELKPLDREERFREKMEALERLGGGIAHEFNNLMTGMLGVVDGLLAGGALAGDARWELEQMRETVWRGATVTRQLLAFSGGQSFSLRETDPNELLQQLAPLIKQLTPPAITLDFDLSASGAVQVDPAHLEQVILSVVVNAIEAMPHGGTLSLATQDIGPFATIAVSDDGPGMDELTLARLFEPFHSTKGPGGGRGLGLASVYGTVRRMEGSTDIESNEGKGTRVRLYFTRVQPAMRKEAAAPAASQATGGETVLVVDDEPSVRAPMSRRLRSLGYFVLEANDGDHALEVMREHPRPIHLVITDLMMPEMDGAELVRHIRDFYPAVRVLFVSGYNPQQFERYADSLDGAPFLAKPFSIETLTTRVREILSA